MKGPIILIANLLTEGRGMAGFTAADAVARIEEAIQRQVDVVITNMKWPSPQVLGRYALEHKEPLAPGNLPAHCELVGGEFWTSEIARHDRLRLAYAVWSVLSRAAADATPTADPASSASLRAHDEPFGFARASCGASSSRLRRRGVASWPVVARLVPSASRRAR